VVTIWGSGVEFVVPGFSTVCCWLLIIVKLNPKPFFPFQILVVLTVIERCISRNGFC